MSDDFQPDELRHHLTTSATKRREATMEFHRWIGRAYGTIPVTEIARLTGLTAPGVYHVLDQLGIQRQPSRK